MLVRSPLRVIAPLLLAAALTTAHADNAAVKKAIVAGYAAEESSLNSHPISFAKFKAVHTPNATFTYKKQSAPIQKFQQGVGLVLAFSKSVKATARMQTLTVTGNKAIATAKLHIDALANLGNMGKKVDPKADANKPSRIVVDATVKDTWVKGTPSWLIKNTQLVTIVGTLNGNKLPIEGFMANGGPGGPGGPRRPGQHRPGGPMHRNPGPPPAQQ
jgi:hypothetical protein